MDDDGGQTQWARLFGKPNVDVVNYIDYLIINAWGGNDDWPRKNFWAGRDQLTGLRAVVAAAVKSGAGGRLPSTDTT